MSGLRERKKLATRAALQHSAVTLYRRHGASAVTVEDICADAGVSPRTFFNYFATKEEAVFSLDDGVPELIERLIVDRPPAEAPLEAVRTAITARLRELSDSETWRERMLLLRDCPELLPKIALSNRAVEEAVAAGVAGRTGRDVDDIAVRTVAAVTFAAQRTAINRWQPGTGPDLPALVDEVFELIAGGLRF